MTLKEEIIQESKRLELTKSGSPRRNLLIH